MKDKRDLVRLPTVRGFETYTANLGVRDDSTDFFCLRSVSPEIAVAAMFTKSHFAGPSVVISRHNLKKKIRGMVAISKNANVGNGLQGKEDTHAILEAVAAEANLAPDQFLIASTGIIGRRYPVERMLERISGIGQFFGPANFDDAARAIMTTDTYPKAVSRRIGEATLVGIAKGVGMIEPDMATLFSFWFTDAYLEPSVLDIVFRRIMEKTFNCLSIDTDTSTSDTALVMSSLAANVTDVQEFETAFLDAATELTEMVAGDGEGATKIIQVKVTGAVDNSTAKQVAKSIVNSPLVKTAIHGADPNWGRILMAIGKSRDVCIDPENVTVSFGELCVYPIAGTVDLFALTDLLRRSKVVINVSLGKGTGQATVWGCDLSAEYVRINGAYST